MKYLIGDLNAIHDDGHLDEMGWRSGIPLAEQMGEALVKGLLHSHPIVRTHPVTGRKWLTINQNYTRFIQDLSPHEGEAISAMLMAHMHKPEFGYRHAWQEGDLLMWDQQAQRKNPPRFVTRFLAGGNENAASLIMIVFFGIPSLW